MRVEVLAFEGCPNREPAVELVERVVSELGLDAAVDVVDVTTHEEATSRRFLGSPTVQVDGVDVAPEAGREGEFALSCRVYRTAAGVSGIPEESWIRDALVSARP